MMKKKRVLALLMASVMIMSTGCEGKQPAVETAETPTEAAPEDTGDSEKPDDTPAPAPVSDVPVVIAADDFSEKFCSLFAASVPDQNVADFTVVTLLKNDRVGDIIYHGIEGETKNYNGTDYTYYGIADCDVTENADGTVNYDFRLRDDVLFSDGEKLTADDAIFTYYVLCDPSYDGGSSLYALPIHGLEEYRSGVQTLLALILEGGEDNTDFTYYTEDQQKAFFEKDLPAAGEQFCQSIADYCLANGYVTGIEKIDACDIANGMVNWGFANISESDGVIGSVTGTEWTLEGSDVPTAADYFAEMMAAYDNDVMTLSDTEKAESPITDFLPDVYKNGIETGESAPNISGIVKTGDYSFSVTLDKVDATAIYQLGTYVTPMHYYGNKADYDYDNNKFGFTKGDLSSVRSKMTKPLGAGPFIFDKYENKTVYMKPNPNYFLGKPNVSELQFRVTLDPDKEPGVAQGTLDISDPSASKERLEQVRKENSNGQLSGDKIVTSLVDVLGYGYIGMNAENVCVGGDPGSEESKNLRKAIATVLSVYRDVVIDSYYGDAASVINYPISNTSWAAPQPSDPDYAVAFSTDVDGNPIYSDGMSEDDRYAAALNAALGFFEAAGYTVKDGKLTAAPAGAKLTYEVLVGGAGQGDHPSFGILTAASEALATIGFDLKINDLTDSSILWSSTEGGTAELWCAAWQATIDPDMFQVYHSEGGSAYMYRIYNKELDEMIMDARSSTNQQYRKAIYKECLDFIVDYAVEIPIYQRQDCNLFSAERIDVNTIMKDQTTFYQYANEIQTLMMK
ncbi:MAG: ABC transporter substrate-binding protein [Lachnospiraceae bacterium]|nr:ABC transporter substrate-binding protein [Lachnospiraceae bacterium]